MALIQWLIDHQIVLGAMIVGILDFLFAVSPALAGNGVLHQIYVFFKKP